jgi:CheY-like chemotaxis protein
MADDRPTAPAPSDAPRPHVHVVLIIEDNADSREALATALETLEMRTVCTDGGEGALGKLRDGLEPCMILLDSLMEGMDAEAFRRAQQADPRFRRFPVALLSGRDDLREQATRLGVRDALLKPVDLDELRDVILRGCRRRSARNIDDGARCEGSTAEGKPCAAFRRMGSHFCWSHDPKTTEERHATYDASHAARRENRAKG